MIHTTHVMAPQVTPSLSSPHEALSLARARLIWEKNVTKTNTVLLYLTCQTASKRMPEQVEPL